MGDAAKLLIFAGLVLTAVGVVLLFLSKIPGGGWRLPGDFFIQKGNFSFYFPLATCIIISVILSILLNLWQKR